MVLPEDDFGTQLQHMIAFQTDYPFNMSLLSSMTLDGLKLLLSNTMGIELRV